MAQLHYVVVYDTETREFTVDGDVALNSDDYFVFDTAEGEWRAATAEEDSLDLTLVAGLKKILGRFEVRQLGYQIVEKEEG